MSAAARQAALAVAGAGAVVLLVADRLAAHPVLLLGVLLAGCAVAGVIGGLAWQVAPAPWPADDGARSLDNHGIDERLEHLARLLVTSDPHALHREVTAVVERILTTRHACSLASPSARAVLGDRLHGFLTDPPLASAPAYHRALGTALDRIEEL